jgi:SAM-dependent methyltransferase
MTDSTTDNPNSQHYASPNLVERIMAGLKAAGKDPENIHPDDLAPVDQFHTGGRQTTLELAVLTGLNASMSIIDLGGGLGGPARLLATRYSCQVTVLDATCDYTGAGTTLTSMTGLSDAIYFHCGDALKAPFEDGSFDVAWTQHSSMNIEDKVALYSEAYRLVRPGGRLAIHEIMAGVGGPVIFPVPWARSEDASFLAEPEQVRQIILSAGFDEIIWRDTTAVALEWFSRPPPASRPPLGLHLLLGDLVPLVFQNLRRNLEEGRVEVVMAVFERR